MTTPEQEREYWDAAAEDPSNIGGVGMPPPSHFARHLDPWMEDAGPWLDLGCGSGRIARLLTGPARIVGLFSPFETIHCLDISQAMLDQIPDHPNLIPHLGDGRTIPLTVPPVSFAWSILMFQHVDTDTLAGYLAEIHRILIPSGLFVAQWVREGAEHDYSHPRSNSDMLLTADHALLEPVALWQDELVPEWSWGVWTR